MTQLLARGVVRVFRLTNEPGGLGLSCTPTGVSLAGVPLLSKTRTGFVPRPASEVASLLRAAYDDDPSGVQLRLCAIAQALNSGDFTKAMIVAVHTRMPELSPEAARRLVVADEQLSKYNYDPDEPRDWRGRWTKDGSAGPTSVVGGETGNDQHADAHNSGQRLRLAENASASAADVTGLSDDDDGDTASEPASLEQTLERKYDDLGPVEFAKQVIQFGDWLGREGRNLSPAELVHALAEYSFLQDRLSFWLNYDDKPVTAQGNLLSAALTLYQGAVNGRIVRVGHLPESMLAVAGMASLFGDGPPRRPATEPALEEGLGAQVRASKEQTSEEKPLAPAQAPEEMDGVGGVADRSEVGIEWNGGLEARRPFEVYLAKDNPNVQQLPEGATAFDLVNRTVGEAISAKSLNTLSAGYIKKPQEIYKKIASYVDAAVNYQPRRRSDLDPAEIESKTVQLAIPEWTSPAQWRYLLRAIIYGKDNGVRIVITRIRE